MLTFLKALLVESLRASGRPELIEVAQWLDNAQDAAVKTIVRLVSQSFKANGRITERTSREIVATKEVFESSRHSGEEAPQRSATPLLDKYVEFLNPLVDVASWRRALILQGFLHTPDCCSLWTFNPEKNVELAVAKDRDISYIPIPSVTGMKVFLLDRLNDDAFAEANERIGENPESLLSELVSITTQEVLAIHQHHIAVRWEEMRPNPVAASFGGAKERLVEQKGQLALDKDFQGVYAMVQSFPKAIEAREKVLRRFDAATAGKP